MRASLTHPKQASGWMLLYAIFFQLRMKFSTNLVF